MEYFNKKTPLICILMILMAMFLNGCVSEEEKAANLATSNIPDKSQANRAAEASKSEKSTPKTEPEVEESKFYENDWRFANDNGYTFTLNIKIWEPVSKTNASNCAHPGDPDTKLELMVDPETDIVIPGQFEVTNTTKGYEALIDTGALFINDGSTGDYAGTGARPAEGDQRIEVEQHFGVDKIDYHTFSSDNTWGYGGASRFGVEWNSPMKNGAKGTHQFFIIIKNYYSPATPDGDQALLDWIMIRPIGSNNEPYTDNYRDVDCKGKAGDIFSDVGMTLSGKVLKGRGY